MSAKIEYILYQSCHNNGRFSVDYHHSEKSPDSLTSKHSGVFMVVFRRYTRARATSYCEFFGAIRAREAQSFSSGEYSLSKLTALMSDLLRYNASPKKLMNLTLPFSMQPAISERASKGIAM